MPNSVLSDEAEPIGTACRATLLEEPVKRKGTGTRDLEDWRLGEVRGDSGVRFLSLLNFHLIDTVGGL